MAAEKGVVDAPHELVSQSFVEQYYHVMRNASDQAHKFYVDGSVVSRPGPDGTMMSFATPEAIKQHYLTCEYKGTTYDVLSVDSQRSLQNGIIIMVVGFLTGKDNLKRKFSQSFYLAFQDTVHVVVNDMYRFVDEETTLTAVESVPETEVAKPVEEIKKTEPVRKIDAPAEKSVKAAEVKKVVSGATPPLEKAGTAQKPKEPIAETAVAPPLNGAKISYASMVQTMSRNAAPFQVKAATVQKPKSVAPPKARAAAAPKSPAVGKPEKKSDQKFFDEPGTSLFVSNLPMDAMPPQVYELFKGFGPIKEDGVQIRSSRASGRCFGFVAFESVASVQSVLKAAKSNSFKLGEYKLRVKEKQVEYDGGRQSGSVKNGGGSKTPTGSANGSKTPTGSADGSKSGNGSADGSKSGNGSADENKTQNGSAGREDDGFMLIKSRRNRRGEGNANGDKRRSS